jgi:hypothetical protein
MLCFRVTCAVRLLLLHDGAYQRTLSSKKNAMHEGERGCRAELENMAVSGLEWQEV